MKKYAGENKEYGPLSATISIQYGKQPDIEDEWKKIVELEKVEDRKKQIDILLTKMEQNAEENGFFGAEQQVVINKLHRKAVLFNDKEMYYQFFEILRNNYLSEKDNISSGAIIKRAIEETEMSYWGSFQSDKTKRLDLTTSEIITQDDPNLPDITIIPSISKLKGENCSACMERAVMAHNLWLLTGKTSYFINVSASECDFGQESDEYKNDGHAFSIVEYDGKYRLFDLSMNNICMLQGNPIEDIENGKPLKVEGPTVNNPGYYANYSKLQQEMVR